MLEQTQPELDVIKTDSTINGIPSIPDNDSKESKSSVKTATKGVNTSLSSGKSTKFTVELVQLAEERIYLGLITIFGTILGLIFLSTAILALFHVRHLDAGLIFLAIPKVSSASGTLFFLAALSLIGSGFCGKWYKNVKEKQKLMQACFCVDVLRTTPILSEQIESTMKKFTEQLTARDQKERSVSLDVNENGDRATVEEEDTDDIVLRDGEFRIIEIKEAETQTTDLDKASKGI